MLHIWAAETLVEALYHKILYTEKQNTTKLKPNHPFFLELEILFHTHSTKMAELNKKNWDILKKSYSPCPPDAHWKLVVFSWWRPTGPGIAKLNNLYIAIKHQGQTTHVHVVGSTKRMSQAGFKFAEELCCFVLELLQTFLRILGHLWLECQEHGLNILKQINC